MVIGSDFNSLKTTDGGWAMRPSFLLFPETSDFSSYVKTGFILRTPLRSEPDCGIL
jgi:hypothetical protein